MAYLQAHHYAAATDEDVERWEAYEAVMHQRAVAKLLGIKKPIPAPWVIKKPKVETAMPVPQPKAKDRKAVSWREVVDAVAQFSSLDPAMIIAPDTKGTRYGRFVRARHIVMLILHLRGNGYAQIGRWIGGRDRTTVLHAVRKMKREITPQEMDLVSRLAGVSC